MQPNDITFFQRFQDDILAGRKTITIRDESESHFKTGDVLRVGRFEDDGYFCTIEVTATSTVTLDTLTEKHAEQENMTLTELKKVIALNVKSLYRKTIDEATPAMIYQAVALAVKDMIIDRWIATHKEYDKQDAKIVYYMSMEFLTGRFLGNNIISLCEQKEIEEALSELGFDLNSIEDQERDPALGNGGLGRLAACFWIPLHL